MIDYHNIYNHEAQKYDLLVNREDWEGNLLPALNSICPLQGQVIIELGAGTGRISRQLSPIVSQVLAIDISKHMLDVGKDRLCDLVDTGTWTNNLLFVNGDNRRLPVKSEVADLVIAGWTLGHLVGWHLDSWQVHLSQVLSEMERVSKAGGYLVIIETLGTGVEVPKAPTPDLAEFHRWLEREKGFNKTWVRTDYRFKSKSEANELVSFFFGSVIVARIPDSSPVILPECTGIWFKQIFA